MGPARFLNAWIGPSGLIRVKFDDGTFMQLRVQGEFVVLACDGVRWRHVLSTSDEGVSCRLASALERRGESALVLQGQECGQFNPMLVA